MNTDINPKRKLQTVGSRIQTSKMNRILFFLVLIFVTFFLLWGKKIFQSNPETKKEYQYLSLFSEIVTLVKTEYVEAVDPTDKFPGAFSALMASLDPLSAYLNKDRTEIFKAYMTGQYYSIGIHGAKVANYLYITDINPGSSAEKAGLKIGDSIKSINGESIHSKSFWEMFLGILSTKAKDIEVISFRRNVRDLKKLQLKTEIEDTATSIKTLKGNILLIPLVRFTKDSADYLRQTLWAKKMPLKLIIDLRGYSGGDLEGFLEIAKLFFKEGGVTLKIKLKYSEEKLPLGSTTPLEYSAVVILNRSTRMYGELLAALFQKYSKKINPVALLIGTKSTGFVSKLKFIEFEDGSSILITQGHYYLDGEKTISQAVQPDVQLTQKEFIGIVDKSISILNKKQNKISTMRDK
jgi:carboxyl-terminal processing protease